MAILFDPASRRIVLDSASTSAAELWSRWADWAAIGDNLKYLPAFRQVGGDDLGSSISIPPYMFLLNGWRVRPMEANHQLIITGNLFVEGGGSPVVNTLGAFNVSTQLTVPVQAQAVSTTGSSGPSAADIAAAVWQRNIEAGMSSEEMLRILMSFIAGNATSLTGPNPTFKSMDGSKVRLAGATDGTSRTINTRDGT